MPTKRRKGAVRESTNVVNPYIEEYLFPVKYEKKDGVTVNTYTEPKTDLRATLAGMRTPQRDPALAENWRAYDRMQQSTERYNEARYKEANKYIIPYIPEKEIRLTTGRYNTGRISTNILDSIYDAAKRTGVPVDIALGLAGRESTFGIGRGFKRGHSITGTDLMSNWQQIQPFIMPENLRKEYNNVVAKYNNGTPLTAEEADVMIGYWDTNDKAVNSTRPLTENPIDNALKFYMTGGYNPGDDRHTKMVEEDARIVMSDPAIQKWYQSRVDNEKKFGGRAKAEFGNEKEKTYIGGTPKESRAKYFNYDTELSQVLSNLAAAYNVSPQLVFDRLAHEGLIDRAIQSHNNSMNPEFDHDHTSVLHNNAFNMPYGLFGLDYIYDAYNKGVTKTKRPINIRKTPVHNESGELVNSGTTNNIYDTLELFVAELASRRNQVKKQYPNLTDSELDSATAARYNATNKYFKRLMSNGTYKIKYPIDAKGINIPSSSKIDADYITSQNVNIDAEETLLDAPEHTFVYKGKSWNPNLFFEEGKLIDSNPAVRVFMNNYIKDNFTHPELVKPTINGKEMKLGGRRKAQLGLDIREGGIAIPIAKNMYYMQGRSHEAGGIGIGPNNKNGLEVEGGEVVKVGKDNIRVFSSVPFLRGVSPAQLVMGGANPDTVFKAQENFKDRNRINDDGTKYRSGGKKPLLDNNYSIMEYGGNMFYTINGNVKNGLMRTGGERKFNSGMRFLGIERANYMLNRKPKIKFVYDEPKEVESEKAETKELEENVNVKETPIKSSTQYHDINPHNTSLGVVYRAAARKVGFNPNESGSTDFRVIDLNNSDIIHTNRPDTIPNITAIWANDFVPSSNKGKSTARKKELLSQSNIQGLDKNKISRYYGFNNGVFKVGSADTFNDDDYIGAVLNKSMKFNKVVRTNNGYQLYYDDTPVNHTASEGKHILYNSNTGKYMLLTNSNKDDMYNYYMEFLKQNGEADAILLDNGRFNRHTYKGGRALTDKELSDYYINDFNRGIDKVPVFISGNMKKYGGISDRPKAPFGKNRKISYLSTSPFGPKYDKVVDIDIETGEQSSRDLRYADPYRPEVSFTDLLTEGYFDNSSPYTFNGRRMEYIPKFPIETYLDVPEEESNDKKVNVKTTPKQTTSGQTVSKITPKYDVGPYKIYRPNSNPTEFDKLPQPLSKIPLPVRDEVDEHWVGQYKPTTVGDWIGLGGNLIGSLASYIGTKNMINDIPMPQKPVAAPIMKLKTRFNINAPLTEINEQEQMQRDMIGRNTSSSNISLARQQRVMNEAQRSRNQLYTQKENTETQLINQDRLNRQSMMSKNIDAYNQWLNNFIQSKSSKAALKATNFNNLISGLTGGIGDMLSRIETRRATNNTIQAMAAANPNVDARQIGNFDYYNVYDKKTGKFIRKTKRIE